MRFSRSSSMAVVAFVLGAAALGVGCVGVLGDFDSGNGNGSQDDAGDSGVVGHDGASTTDAPSSDASDAAKDSATADSGADATTPADGASGDAAVEAGPDAGPFDPTKLNGLVAWLDSDATGYTISNSSTVIGWADRSGNNNPAKNQLPTTSPTANPANPTFNNRASLHFDGKSYLYILNNASMTIGDGDFLIAVVASVAAGTTSLETLIAKHDSASPFAGPALYATPSKIDAVLAPSNGIVSQFATANDGNAHYFGAWRNGMTLTVQTDRTISAQTITSIPTTSGATDLDIGMELTSTLQNYFTGDIAEVVIVVGAVAPARATALRDYMLNKYNL